MERSVTFSAVLLLLLNVALVAQPSVNAGSDVTVTALTLPVVVQLAGSAPTWFLNGVYGHWCHPQTIGWWKSGEPQPLTFEWSQVDGPATVDFQNANDPKTTATFHAPRTYLLALWCSDGLCSCTAATTVDVGEAGGPGPGAASALPAHWDFREGSGTIAHDLSGNDHDGALRGGPRGGPLWVAGYDGGALRFDGRDDHVDTAITENLAEWTVCCWVSSPSAPAAALASGPIQREQNFQINWNHTDPTFRSAAGLKVAETWYAASFGPLVSTVTMASRCCFPAAASRR